MKTLFNQLSEEHRDEIVRRQDSHLLHSLMSKSYKHELSILDMMSLSEILGVEFGILAVTKLFKQ